MLFIEYDGVIQASQESIHPPKSLLALIIRVTYIYLILKEYHGKKVFIRNIVETILNGRTR